MIRFFGKTLHRLRIKKHFVPWAKILVSMITYFLSTFR
jgi:hypothetical protein